MNPIGTADVVIIGGGIVGVSTAWNLARMGLKNVMVLERATIAAGASGRTGAILRQHYTNRPEAALAQRGWQIFRDWPHLVGGNCGYVPQGLVVTIETGEENGRNAELLRRNVALQRDLGIDTRVVTRQELAELQPFGWFADITIAAYEAESGYVDAIAATHAMAQARYLHGHACLYDMTPDAHPIIGPAGPEGLYVAAGFCGAGFKKGPAVGQCLAEEILHGRSSAVDLSPFRLSRFDDDGWKQPWSDTEYALSSDFGHKF